MELLNCENCEVRFYPEKRKGKCPGCGTVYKKKGEDWIVADFQEPEKLVEPGSEVKEKEEEDESSVELLSFDEIFGAEE